MAMKRRMPGGARNTITSLNVASKNWKTPHGLSNQDHSGKMGAGGEQATRWPTARSEDAECCGNHPGATDSLTGAAKQWHTPTKEDGKLDNVGLARYSDKGNTADKRLRNQARVWPTPQNKDYRSGVTGNIAKKNSRPLCEVACQSSLPARKISKRGGDCSEITPRLNPLFVEHLMGFPLGWTASEPLAMVSFHLWRRLHSERLHWLLSNSTKPPTRSTRAIPSVN